MKYGFGVDVGGTTVKLGLFDEACTLLEKWEIPTHTEADGARILPEIADAIDACLLRHGIAREAVLGIGIGVPGPVDDSGNVNRCVNLNWGVFNLHETLGKRTGFRVKGGNDANVAALGEHCFGGGSGCHSSMMVTLGTGVGGGIVLDGKVLSGAHGVAGEIGHITVDPNETTPCTCGRCGCVEQYASARGIAMRTKRALAATAQPTLLREYAAPTAKDVFACAAQGDTLAQEILEQTYAYLGAALANACCVCDPEVVILGGGVSKAGRPLLEGVQRHFEAKMFHACRGTRFALAQLGNDAGIYGSFQLLRTALAEQ